ncbi:putative T7SS-secreted protein [Streptomyces sp. NPDC008137]|uniref:putative T7SS-secreted protein n=1 Tax=Streptomyces sp. NPDC008137 TaxID=3364813 RepID=UPI0036EE18EB
MSASSKPRPRDWQPLVDSDPVPGDPEEIRDEVKHMKAVASSLRDQSDRLKAIKRDDELKGKYAAKLRDDSEVLEKHLREVASRYERVHVHLSNWANELEHYQGEADKVLDNAKRKQEELDTERAKKDTGDGKTPSPSESGTEGDPLREYRNKLDDIVGDRDRRAAHYAKEIRNEIDDIIEDSPWDDIKGWIHENIDSIKWVLDFAGWAATALAFLAPFVAFIPIIGQIAIAISVGVLLARMVLFAAGEASLGDVIMDAVGLVTFGVGVKMLAKLKMADKAVKTAAQVQRRDRIKVSLRVNRAARDELTRVIATTTDDGLKNFARGALNRMRKEMSQNAGRVTDEAPVRPNSLERLGFGDDGARSSIENIRRNSELFPDAAASVGKSEAYYNTAVAAAVTGATADVADKSLGKSDVLPDKMYSETYDSFKGDFMKLPEDTHW